MAKEKTFTFTGDIKFPGRVSVKARTLEEAIIKADTGEFTVFDKSNKHLAFDWNGDKDTVEVSND